jgi:hypothetical protein
MGIVVSGVILSLGFSLGCGSDTTGPGAKTAAQRYWQLTLNHHAITLATISPYDTIQLIATPRTITGDTLTTTERPIFTTSDTSITIDSTGFVRVHGTDTKLNIVVTAKLTVGGHAGLTLTDQATINVVQQTSAGLVPMMDSLIFRPVAGDSARRAIIPDTGLDVSGTPVTQDLDIPVVRDAQGNAIPDAAVRFTSSDRSIARFANASSGTVTAIGSGAVLLTAEATVYGRSKTDSIRYVVGMPLLQEVVYGGTFGQLDGLLQRTLSPPNRLHNQTSSLVVGLGGAVIWMNRTLGLVDDSMDVQFDDTVGIRGPTVPTRINDVTPFFLPFLAFAYPPDPNANIPAMGTIQVINLGPGFDFYVDNTSNSAIRYFTRLGTYHWHSVRRGISGSIRVVSNDSLN